MIVSRDARAVDDVFRHHDIAVAFAPLGGFFSYEAVKTLAGILSAEEGPTVVHCHDTRDAFAALVARKLIARHNILVVLTRHYVRRAGHTPLHKYVYRNVDDMIFVSEIAKRVFLAGWSQRKILSAQDPRLHVIHNSLNIQLQPISPEPDKGPVTAIYLGRLAPDKGIEDIIDALVRMKDMKFRIRMVGTGHPDYVDSLRNKAVEQGVMSMIDWPRHKENTRDFIRNSHFGVSPSRAQEAFGLSNIECMAEGRPVITTDNGAQPEYITDGVNGILVPPRNSDILAIEMRRLAKSIELRQQLGTSARAKFEQELSWLVFIKKLDSIYATT